MKAVKRANPKSSHCKGGKKGCICRNWTKLSSRAACVNRKVLWDALALLCKPQFLVVMELEASHLNSQTQFPHLEMG